MDVTGFNWTAIPDPEDQKKIETNFNKRVLDINEDIVELEKNATKDLPAVMAGIFRKIIRPLGLGQTAAKIKDLEKEKRAIDEIRKSRTESVSESTPSEVPKIGELIAQTKKKIATYEALPKTALNRDKAIAKAKKQLAGLELIQLVTQKVLEKNNPITPRAKRQPPPLSKRSILPSGSVSVDPQSLKKTITRGGDRIKKEGAAILATAKNRLSRQPAASASGASERSISEVNEQTIQRFQRRLNACKTNKLDQEQFSSEIIDVGDQLQKLETELKKLKPGSFVAFERELRNLEKQFEPSASTDMPRRSMASGMWGWDELSRAVQSNNRAGVEAILESNTFDLEELSDAREEAEESGYDDVAQLIMQKELEVMDAAPPAPSPAALRTFKDELASDEFEAVEISDALRAIEDPAISGSSAISESFITSEESKTGDVETRTKNALHILADLESKISNRKAEIEEKLQAKYPRLPDELKQIVIDRKIGKDSRLKDILHVKEQIKAELIQLLESDGFLEVDLKVFLADLSKESRRALKGVVTLIGTKLSGEISQAAASQDTEKQQRLNPRLDKLKEVKEELTVIAQESANKHLMDLLKGKAAPLEHYSNAELIEGVILSGGSKISPGELFSLIAHAMPESTEQEREQLVSFCVLWLERNVGTKGFDKAIEFIKENLLPLITESQKAHLSAAMAKEVVPKELPKLEAGANAFVERMDLIAKGNLKGAAYKEFVLQVADDLKKIQGRYYVAHTPDTLFKNKWSSAPPAEVAYAENYNRVANYLNSLLVKEGAPAEERANLIKFFVDVGDNARKNGDLATAMVIGASFRSVPVLRMHSAWNVVQDSFSHNKKLEKLLAVTSPNASYKDYRRKATLVGFDKVQPYLGVTATDQTFLFDKFIRVVSTDTETYDFKNFFEMLRGWINDALEGQKKMELELKREPKLKTDLLTNLEQHQVVSDDSLIERVGNLRKGELEVKDDNFTLE